MAASSRNGIILESYARSAGTADAAIPSEVVSRRTTTRHERQQLQKKRDEEEEKSKKQRKEQEAVARILQQKWLEEDQKKQQRKRRAEDQGRSESSSEEEDRERGRKEKKETKSSKQSSSERDKAEVARQLAAMWAAQAESEEEQPDHPPAKEERIGGWVSMSTMPQKDEKGREPERKPPQPSGQKGGWGHHSRVAAALNPSAGVKAKVSGVFGLSDDEDDGDRRKKELERAAKSRAQRTPTGLAAAPVASSSSLAVGAGPAASQTLPSGSPDATTVLMKMAEFKRQCKGKRVPMPPELREMYEKIAGTAWSKDADT